MSDSYQGVVENLYSFPIKGLSAVCIESANLRAGDGFPGDRLFGFAKANSGFDRDNPQPLPKDRFLVLMEQAKLAELTTRFDEQTRLFTASLAGQDVLRVDLKTEAGQEEASAFFVDLLNLTKFEKPFFAEAQPHRFTDVSVVSPRMMNAVSFINKASIRDFEEKTGTSVDPLRFRGNIVFDGWPAFHELDCVGKTITVGDVSFKVLLRTQRCAATEVNPQTGARDIRLPALLRKTYGHFDMGIYAEVLSDGAIRAGDPICVS